MFAFTTNRAPFTLRRPAICHLYNISVVSQYVAFIGGDGLQTMTFKFNSFNIYCNIKE